MPHRPVKRRLALAGAALWMVSGCAATPPPFAPLIARDAGLSGNKDHAAHHRAGLAHLTEGRHGLAVFELRKALREKPEAIETLNAIGIAYDYLGQFEVSRNYYERAVALDPTAVQTLNNLGRSALRQGNTASAIAWLERAERLAPDSPEVAENLADARDRAAAALATHQPSFPPRAAVTPALGGWVERTDRLQQTLVTAAPVPVVETLAFLDLPPEVVSVAGAPDRSLARRPDAAEPLRGESAGVVAPHPSAEASAKTSAKTSEGEKPKSAPPAPARLEIANGAGRRGMAARMQAHLAEAGAPRARLTNADHFAYATSAIFYRSGFADSAAAFAQSLPLQIALIADDRQRSDIRLRLGGDLLAFDQVLLKKG